MRGWLMGLSLAVLAGPALAQGAGDLLPSHDTQVELAGYADCVVHRKAYRAPVQAFLKVGPDSVGFYDASMKAADMTCLDQAAARRQQKLEMRLQPATFRDALYPALYRLDFGAKGPPAGIADVPAMDPVTEFDAGTTLSDIYYARRSLGDCVARAAPASVHALLMAKPYSKDENAAVEALKPALGGCIAKGQNVTLNRPTVRAVAGEAMYKLAVAARDRASATG